MPSCQWQNQTISYHQKFTDIAINSRQDTTMFVSQLHATQKPIQWNRTWLVLSLSWRNSATAVGEQPFGLGKSIRAGILILC